jgi:hypothetical protein
MIKMGVFLESFNLTGIIIGAAAFLIIALGRYTTILAEYYFTRKFWIGFLIIGLLGIVGSLWVQSLILSATLSILGFTYIWGIGEIIEQEERVKKGWFPENPNRKKKK